MEPDPLEQEQAEYYQYVETLAEIADRMTLKELKEHMSFMNQWAARLYDKEKGRRVR